nr:hypothetical protein [Tanacetum cinerariifolium]
RRNLEGIEKAITMTQKLIKPVMKHNSVQETNNHKRKLEDRRNTTNGNKNNYRNNNPSNDHHQQQNKRQETFRTYTENKRTSTAEASAMTHAAIRKLVADSVATTLEAQAATMASTNNPNRNSRPRKTHVARSALMRSL